MASPRPDIDPAPEDTGDLPAGGWLFRQGGLLMGPVDGRVLVQKIYAGELAADTPVADERGETWRRLDAVPDLALHLARAEARRRVLQERRAEEAAARRRRILRWLAGGVAAALLVAAVGAGAWWVSTRSEVDAEQAELAALGITISPPVIALASESPRDPDDRGWLDVDVAPEPESPARRPARRPAARTRARTPPAGASTPSPADPSGLTLERRYDMDHINAVVRREQRSLFPCIRAEVGRTAFRGALPFEFVIENDGRVGRLWIDRKELRGGPLEACFKEKMSAWRFQPFEGERPTVSQSFNIGG